LNMSLAPGFGKNGRDCELFFDMSFIDQHDGNIILDWINPFTLDALQTLVVRGQGDGLLAQRTDQDFQ
jgi:hypothetical protein